MPLAVDTAAAPVYFTADIDHRIADATARRTACDLGNGSEPAISQTLAEPGMARPAAWSPWLTDYCPLRDYVGSPDTARYARPVPVPNRAGRRLFLARATDPFRPALLLLEFEAAHYRFVWLGRQQGGDFGGEASHRLYRSPGRELLAVQSVEGTMGAGRCASGSADTWLQVWDVSQATCLLNTPIGWYFTALGCDDDDGTDHPGGELTVTRRWQLRDQGRTLWLGGYRVEGQRHYGDPGPDAYYAARLTRQLQEDLQVSLEPATRPLPAGTYRLAGRRYHHAR